MNKTKQYTILKKLMLLLGFAVSLNVYAGKINEGDELRNPSSTNTKKTQPMILPIDNTFITLQHIQPPTIAPITNTNFDAMQQTPKGMKNYILDVFTAVFTLGLLYLQPYDHFAFASEIVAAIATGYFVTQANTQKKLSKENLKKYYSQVSFFAPMSLACVSAYHASKKPILLLGTQILPLMAYLSYQEMKMYLPENGILNNN